MCIMLWKLVVSTLLVAAASACGSSGRCKANSNIHGVFIISDGTGTFKKSWESVMPFVKLFKDFIDHELPIWFIQFSSLPDFCNGAEGKETSWDCYGREHDPCNPNRTNKTVPCPKIQMAKIPANWTDQEFDEAVKKIYSYFQGGWTRPFTYLEMAADQWIEAKKEMGLGDDARALVVLHSDGEANDTEEQKEQATRKFKEANLKFLGVYQNSANYNYTYNVYNELMDNPAKPDVIDVTSSPLDGVQLNEELVKHIVKKGC